MTATYSPGSHSERGAYMSIALSDAGDSLRIAMVPEYGSRIPWHLGRVAWVASEGVTVEAQVGPPGADVWIQRTGRHAVERGPVTAFRFTSPAGGDSAVLFTYAKLAADGIEAVA